MANNIIVLDGTGGSQIIRTTQDANVHTHHHNAQLMVGNTHVTNANPIPVKFETQGQLNKASSASVVLASDDNLVVAVGTNAETPTTGTAAGTLNAMIAQLKNLVYAAEGTVGASIPSGGFLFLGSDGTLARPIYVGTDGRILSRISADARSDFPAYANNTANSVSMDLFGNMRTANDTQGFDIVATPTTSTSAYAPGDIVGTVMQLNVGAKAGDLVQLHGVSLLLKTVVYPDVRIIFFSSALANTTITDNTTYNLNATDAFKVVKTYSSSDWINHGGCVELSLDNLKLNYQCEAAGNSIYAMVVTDTTMTLGSTTDMQFRTRGQR